MRLLQVWYHDHHSQIRLNPKKATESTNCTNMSIGEVIYEDEEWLRLCYEKDDVDGDGEEWGVMSIRKADIVKKRELRYD